jgi:putative radical SAM enzyme (TIGR03279 family)
VPSEGGIVRSLIPGGPAEGAGLEPADRVLAINGVVPRDVIDVRLDTALSHVEIDLERAGSRFAVVIDKEPDEDLGIEFESAAFDRMKLCNNTCDFCFIRGLPRGLRRSLYLKDDDFRYSFLYGNFITLTNLSEAEWRRLIFQRLSPLRVSVHATDPELRRRLLGNAKAPPILDQIDELGAHAIRIHAQIVLMPGLNDGAALDQTIRELASRYPTVESAAVVPVGLTRHSRTRTIRPVQPDDAASAIDIVETHQRINREVLGTRFVYAGDEVYFLAGRSLPPCSAYEDYPQLQNGVGLVQLFRDGWRRAARRLPAAVSARTVCWATGALMEPILEALADDLRRIEGVAVEVVAVENSLFGGEVSVSGLVPGADVVRALAARRYDRIVLPRSMFDTEGRQTIDGWTPTQIADALDTEVVVAAGPAELIGATLDPGSRGVAATGASPLPDQEATLCAAS